MTKNGHKVLDSDMHILEPVDLWQRYIDSRFKHLAPIGTADHVRDLRLVGPDGRAWGRPIDLRRALCRRPAIFFIGTKNSSKPTMSAAGRLKCNSTPWPMKASMSRYSIRAAV